MSKPGLVVFLGSGETAYAGGQVFEALAQRLPRPLNVNILETPAGFELNSERVAGRVAEYMNVRLQNYNPTITLIPARKRGTAYSPDDADLLRPMLDTHLIYMGAGSPSYTVRQLSGSLAWDVLRARHRLGAAVFLTSAATLAMGKLSLPVYEIYKVGEDPHWKPGLDFLGDYGLSLVIIPHWNNNDGGSELDTSRCYIGQGRFQELLLNLPADVTVLGLDEKTAVMIDFATEECSVLGQDGIHILLRTGQEVQYHSGERFALSELGQYDPLLDLSVGIPSAVWEHANEVDRFATSRSQTVPLPPAKVVELVDDRQLARSRQDWAESDRLRDAILALGWQVQDTPGGPQVIPVVR